MQLHLHEQVPGQSVECLEGLVRAAERLARTPRMQRSESVASVVAWIRAQPFLPDTGSFGPPDGCRPRQRARFWPTGGLNCWEAVLHYVAAAMVHGLPPGATLHIYDVRAEGRSRLIGRRILRPGRRHVYPVLVHPDGREEIVELDSLVRPELRVNPAPSLRRRLANAVTTLEGAPVTEEELRRAREGARKTPPPGGPLSPEDVARLTWYDRLYEGMVRGLAELPGEQRRRLVGLLTTETAWGMLLLVGFWVAGHAIGLSQLADLGVTIYGAYAGFKAIWQVGGDLWKYGVTAIQAKTEGDLNVAGQHFAAAMSEAMVTSLETFLGSRVFRLARAAMLKVQPLPRQMEGRLVRLAEEVAGRINRRLEGRPRERPEDLMSREPPNRERTKRERQGREPSDRERTKRERYGEGLAGTGLVEGGRQLGRLRLPGFLLLGLFALGLMALGRPTPARGGAS